jgi:hypothetical protein
VGDYAGDDVSSYSAGVDCGASGDSAVDGFGLISDGQSRRKFSILRLWLPANVWLIIFLCIIFITHLILD